MTAIENTNIRRIGRPMLHRLHKGLIHHLHPISGAGVILLHWTHGDTSEMLPHVLMVRRGHRSEYSFTGGFDDTAEGFAITASRELEEESSELFQVSPNHLQGQIHTSLFCGLYRAYLLPFETAVTPTRADFHANQRTLRAAGRSRHYFEATNLARVPLGALIQAIQSAAPDNDLQVVDDLGRRIRVFARAAKLLRRASARGLWSHHHMQHLWTQRITLDRHEVNGIVRYSHARS